MIVLSIDPSTKQPVGALWEDGELEGVYLLRHQPPRYVDLVVCESQQIYGRIGVNPANIIKLAQAAGATVQAMGAPEVVWVLPAVWKGQTSKAKLKLASEYVIHDRNMARLGVGTRAGQLYEEITLRHKAPLVFDIVDAVGIGLWWFEQQEAK